MKPTVPIMSKGAKKLNFRQTDRYFVKFKEKYITPLSLKFLDVVFLVVVFRVKVGTDCCHLLASKFQEMFHSRIVEKRGFIEVYQFL